MSIGPSHARHTSYCPPHRSSTSHELISRPRPDLWRPEAAGRARRRCEEALFLHGPYRGIFPQAEPD
eukprot:12376561-Alexandrium_andersonii.AAC.1